MISVYAEKKKLRDGTSEQFGIGCSIAMDGETTQLFEEMTEILHTFVRGIIDNGGLVEGASGDDLLNDLAGAVKQKMKEKEGIG